MPDGLKIASDAMARKACVFNFLPLFASRLLFSGAQQKVKESILCALCDSSDVSGRSSQSEDRSGR